MISKVNGCQSAGIGSYDLADFIIQDNTIWETPKDFKSVAENVYANPTIPPIEIKLLKYHKAKLMEEALQAAGDCHFNAPILGIMGWR